MPLKKRPETHRPIQMAIFDIFARFTSALLPSSSFNRPVSCFHYYHFLSISLWMLAVWLDFFFYFSSSFERFCCTIFFSFSCCLFFLSLLAPDAAVDADRYTATERKTLGRRINYSPETLHCQHQSLSQWVSEWEYMTTLQLLISTSISQSSTTTAEMIRFLLGEESE